MARWHRRPDSFGRLAVILALLSTIATTAPANEPITFDRDEQARILASGPWPLPTRPDPSNRLSGNPVAIRLGRALFFDEGLSRFGALSCASCHKPDKAWGDGRARASAAASLDRNTPSLYNLRYIIWFGWDGGADSLWMQSIRPILDPREMAASAEHVREHLASKPALAADVRRLAGVAPARLPAEHALVIAAKALAAFQETITTRRTPFDAFRDALARRDQAAMARYPVEAQRGLRVFIGRGHCSGCHSGPLFSGVAFYDTGLTPAVAPVRVDRGRQGGLEKLQGSPFTLLGRYNDAPRRATGARTKLALAHIAPGTFGAFRTPSLRNVALTGPYMHDGSKPTLADAVRHYTTLDETRLAAGQGTQLRRIALSEADIADLVAFLESLTEQPAAALQQSPQRR